MHHFVACANTKALRRNCAPPQWGEWLAQRVGSGMGCGGYVQGDSTCLMISHTSQAGGHSGVCGVLCLIGLCGTGSMNVPVCTRTPTHHAR